MSAATPGARAGVVWDAAKGLRFPGAGAAGAEGEVMGAAAGEGAWTGSRGLLPSWG